MIRSLILLYICIHIIDASTSTLPPSKMTYSPTNVSMASRTTHKDMSYSESTKEMGIESLRGCWKEKNSDITTEKFVPLFRSMSISPMLSLNLAKNKRSTVAIAFKKDNPKVITWIGRMIPDGEIGAIIFANYSSIKADNMTTYTIPLNMLTGNTNATHVIFEINGKYLTLNMVNELKENERLVSIEWSVSEDNEKEMREKWTHFATKTEATSFFEKVENDAEDPTCRIS